MPSEPSLQETHYAVTKSDKSAELLCGGYVWLADGFLRVTTLPEETTCFNCIKSLIEHKP